MQRVLWLAAALVAAALMPTSTAAAAEFTFVGQFGGVIGSGPGQFVNPDDLAVDSAGKSTSPTPATTGSRSSRRAGNS